MSNRFAKFAATSKASTKLAKSKSTASDGWLASKRRGRDDTAIQQDRDRALKARSKKPAAKKPAAKKKKKDWSDDDDNDEMDDFVVDDDDEIEEDWDSNSDNDDDEIEIVEPRRSTKTPKNTKTSRRRKQLDDDDDEFIASPPPSDRKAPRTSLPLDSDEEEEEFVDMDDEDEELDVSLADDSDDSDDLGLNDIHTPPIVKKKQSSKFFKNTDEVGQRAAAARKALLEQKKKKKASIMSDSDDDDDDIAEEPPLATRKKNGSKTTAKKPITSIDLSSDESDAPVVKKKTKGSKKKPISDDNKSSPLAKKNISRTRTKKTTKASVNLLLSSDDDDSIAPATKRDMPREKTTTKRLKKKTEKKSSVVHLGDSDDDDLFSTNDKTRNSSSVVVSTDSSSSAFFQDDDETPKKKATKKRKNASEERVASLSKKEAEESDFIPSKAVKKTKRKRQIEEEDDDDFNQEEDAMDEDEQVALALAISASQAESPTKQKYRDEEEEDSLLAEEEDEEDDDEDDASHVDETVDERRVAASKVLDSANRLSQQVLRNMMEWSSEGGAAATQGMIVDGALALTSCAPTTVRKEWISQDQMKKICPKVILADYQLIGVNWLAMLHEMKVDVDGMGQQKNVNGILADVMGLGKTVQTIAFLAWLHAKDNKSKGDVVDMCDSDDDTAKKAPRSHKRVHVVVVPASVLDNWMGEFEKFAPQLSVIKYHGPMARREELRFDLERRLPRKKKEVKVKGDVDVVLTTFSYFSGNKADDRKFLRRFDFDYMVVDEAHCLKNPDSNAYQNLDRFDTAHRLLLTGTPVQNSPKELMSLICFLMPLFKTAGKAGWDDDENKNDGGASMLEHFVSLEGGGSDAMSDAAAYRKLKQLFAPFVLRRGKDVLSQTMPKKTREVLRVPLNPSIRTMYNDILATHLKNKTGNKKAIGGNQAARQHLFTTLRKVANHPLLLRNRYTSPSEIEHLARHLRMYGYFGHDDACSVTLVKKELEKFSDFDIHLAALDVIDESAQRLGEMKRYVLAEEDMFCAPKLEKLRTLIPDLVNKGHRLLIFSQWTNCLDLLGCLMESLKYKFFRLDGQTAISTRQDMINDFNNDPSIPVFLLSTKAGGMGINLTAADVCILHDLDFNPFNDLQAEDRCHRIGQTKPVTVIKMVTTETVDDDIYTMQQRKTQMNAAILEKGGSIESAAEKKKDQEAIKSMLQNQLDRYLSSETTTKNGGGMMKFLKKK